MQTTTTTTTTTTTAVMSIIYLQEVHNLLLAIMDNNGQPCDLSEKQPRAQSFPRRFDSIFSISLNFPFLPKCLSKIEVHNIN